MQIKRIILAIVHYMIIFGMFYGSSAEEHQVSSAVMKDVSGSYCGIYSLYSIMKFYKVDIPYC